MDLALACAIIVLVGLGSYLGVSHPLVALGLVFVAAILLVVLIVR